MSARGLEEHTTQAILEAIAGLDYGSVEVTVHDGTVVQIDRRQRIRLSRKRAE